MLRTPVFGPGFTRGLLVVQDGFKQLPSGPQNFKYVAWDDVAEALKLRRHAHPHPCAGLSTVARDKPVDSRWQTLHL